MLDSTTVHQAVPVTRGVRLVAINWIQSWVDDPFRRELLLQAEEAKRAILDGGDRERQRVLVESLRTNLFRLWSDA